VSGPDLEQGVADADVREGVPLLGPSATKPS
jgi:hypothetical protein